MCVSIQSYYIDLINQNGIHVSYCLIKYGHTKVDLFVTTWIITLSSVMSVLQEIIRLMTFAILRFIVGNIQSEMLVQTGIALFLGNKVTGFRGRKFLWLASFKHLFELHLTKTWKNQLCQYCKCLDLLDHGEF